MSITKLAGLLAGFALAVGLIGSGVSAAFTAQVSAVQNIQVGTLGCGISSAQATSTAASSVTYQVPDIQSTAASNAPFDFTVSNTGTIPAVLQVSATALASPFSDILALPVANVTLPVGGTQPYHAGIAWGTLQPANEGKNVSITYTVNCNDTGAQTVTFFSTNFGVYAGQNSIRFGGTGSGFTPGDTVDIVYKPVNTPPFEAPQDLAGHWGILGESAPVVDANGSFSYWFADNCHDGVAVTTDQPMTVTATDIEHPTIKATGTGILACSLMQ